MVWRCPAYRWRELGSGFSTERERALPRHGCLLVEVGGEREELQAVKSREWVSTGCGVGKSGRLIVVVKPL